jgi:hypothetical protein
LLCLQIGATVSTRNSIYSAVAGYSANENSTEQGQRLSVIATTSNDVAPSRRESQIRHSDALAIEIDDNNDKNQAAQERESVVPVQTIITTIPTMQNNTAEEYANAKDDIPNEDSVNEDAVVPDSISDIKKSWFQETAAVDKGKLQSKKLASLQPRYPVVFVKDPAVDEEEKKMLKRSEGSYESLSSVGEFGNILTGFKATLTRV